MNRWHIALVPRSSEHITWSGFGVVWQTSSLNREPDVCDWKLGQSEAESGRTDEEGLLLAIFLDDNKCTLIIPWILTESSKFFEKN